jgi:hypothetical protein
VTEEKRRIEVNWVQSLAGALAAVTSAVLLSTVGVAGTLIGAALGSLAATLGSAIYSFYIRETKAKVEEVTTVAASRLGRAHARVREASRDVAAGEPGAEQELARADADLQRARVLVEEKREEPTQVGWRTVLAGLPWKRIALVALGVFIAAMVAIVSFELITGRAISSYTGGSDSHQRTSIPGLGGGGAGGTDQQPGTPATPSAVPSDSIGTTTGPTPSPSPSGTTSETAVPPLTEAPSSSPSPTPSAPPTTSGSTTSLSPTPSP